MAAHTWPAGDANQMPLDLPNHFPQLNPVYGLQQPADLFNPFIANAAVLQQKVRSYRTRFVDFNFRALKSKISSFLTDIIKNEVRIQCCLMHMRFLLFSFCLFVCCRYIV